MNQPVYNGGAFPDDYAPSYTLDDEIAKFKHARKPFSPYLVLAIISTLVIIGATVPATVYYYKTAPQAKSNKRKKR